MRPHALLPALVFASCLAGSVPLYAGSIPDWMEHWEFGIDVEEDDGAEFFLDPILPLYRHPTNERVLFLEPRWQFANGAHLFNLGTGVRQLVPDKTWLLGANMFYDYETNRSHYRLGWGLEALSHYAEARSNVYLALSQQRLVEESGPILTIEEAVNGFDVEVGAPIPYYSRLKLFGGVNWYNFEKFNNRYGWTLRAEYTPVPALVIDGLLGNDTKGNVDWGMRVAVRIPFGGNDPRQARSPLRLDDTAFPESNAEPYLFKLVERHHEIVVERRQETGGMSVEIARGT